MKPTLSKFVTSLSFTTTIAICWCVRICVADPSYVGYRFTGAGYNGGQPTGKTAGGYYILDQNATPLITGPPDEQIATYPFAGGAAVDDDLAGGVDPFYISGTGNVKYISTFEPNGVYWDSVFNLNNHFAGQQKLGGGNGGPIVTSSTKLGDAIASAGYFGTGKDDHSIMADSIGSGSPLPDRFVSLFVTPTTTTTFTWDDIVKHPKSLKLPTVTGPNITASFTPTVTIGGVDFPVALSDAAKLFGVNHFNWKQEVAVPSYWTSETHKVSDGTFESTTPRPKIDPITSTSPDLQYWDFNPNNGPTFPVVTTYSFVPDTAPFYYNEGDQNLLRPFDLLPNTFQDHLNFSDAPRTPMQFDPNPNKQFRTELVGVMDNGKEVDTGLGFTWDSNAVYDGNGSDEIIIGGVHGLANYLSTTDSANLPAVVAGGISNVQVFSPIPEPSSLFLLAIGAISLLFRRMR